MSSVRTQTVYFAYGSNLHLEQMMRRCPESRYLGLGKLQNHKFIINSRGYANVIPSPGHDVAGLCYLLSQADERRLDASEGVPRSYQKKYLRIQALGTSARIAGRRTREVNEILQGEICRYQGRTLMRGQNGRFEEFEIVRPTFIADNLGLMLDDVLVYVDGNNVTSGVPKEEYRNRIRLGVRDTIGLGVLPQYFIQNVAPEITR